MNEAEMIKAANKKGFDYIGFRNMVNTWNLEYFAWWELLHRCEHLHNSFPPRSLWLNMCYTAKGSDWGRKQHGKPWHVSSGFRNPVYNQTVGGVPQSKHMEFMALDLYCNGDAIEMFSLLDEARYRGIVIGGLGYYKKKNIVHLDCRNTIRTFGDEAPRYEGFVKS